MPSTESNGRRRDLALEGIEHFSRRSLTGLHTVKLSAEVTLAEAQKAAS